MILPGEFRVWLYKDVTDMRKAINGLSQIVVEHFETNLQDGDLYIFYNKARDRIKVLYWHYNGFCLLHKRLEEGRFKIPSKLGDNLLMNKKQMYRLLEGLHFIQKGDKVYDTFF
jgi:transposase